MESFRRQTILNWLNLPPQNLGVVVNYGDIESKPSSLACPHFFGQLVHDISR